MVRRYKVQTGAVVCLLASIFSLPVFAADIEWNGEYRVEFDSLHNPDLATPSRELDYGLQTLILRPKIIASDGFTIRSQFNVFNNAQYPNSQLGQQWGNNVHTPGQPLATATGTPADNSNVLQGAGAPGTINVSQLYLTWDMEFGSLVIGRTPLQFGLGMTYSAGANEFDHFYNTLDMVGYKLVYGNLYLMPMVGKSSSGEPDRDDDVDDYIAQLQYQSPEGDFEMGAMYHLRRAGNQGSDAPTGIASGNGTAGQSGGSDTLLGGPCTGTAPNQVCPNNMGSVGIQMINFYALKDTPTWRFGAEFGMQQGRIGVQTATGQQVTIGGFGLATELEYRPHDSDWKFGLKAGYASGDDPNNAGEYGGYTFNRNYDVAFMLFNHPLGVYDLFRTRLIGGGGGAPVMNGAGGPYEINSPDVEAISNVIYFAPYVTYKLGDRWNMKGVLATGYLNSDPFADGGGSRNLGVEVDYSINFMPRKGVTWSNTAGALFPGSAWKGDGSGPTPGDDMFTFGLETQAAISF